MLKNDKERLSSLMDGNQYEGEFVDDIVDSADLQQYWYRCHIIRDVMQDKLHSSALTLNIVDNVANAIALDGLYEQTMANPSELSKPDNLFMIKLKEIVGKMSQVGLAACVTLAVIAGVQYQTGSSSDSPILNTMPVGVSISPVGGAPSEDNIYQPQQTKIEQQQYNKIRLLIQDYELQKRLNVQ